MDEDLKLDNSIILLKYGIYLKTEKSLVITDVHLGIEASLNDEGILIPRHELENSKSKINKSIETIKRRGLKVNNLIINGDLKHEFGRINKQEWRGIKEFINFLKTKFKKITLLKGNHDNLIIPILKNEDVELKEFEVLNNILITHGHKIPREAEKDYVKTIIIGHEHPAVTLGDSIRKETFKAFLIGKWNRKKLIVMPSFCSATIGSNVLEKKISPFLKKLDISNFELIIVGDKLYKFGRIKNIREKD